MTKMKITKLLNWCRFYPSKSRQVCHCRIRSHSFSLFRADWSYFVPCLCPTLQRYVYRHKSSDVYLLYT